jgi:hypothetical protein
MATNTKLVPPAKSVQQSNRDKGGAIKQRGVGRRRWLVQSNQTQTRGSNQIETRGEEAVALCVGGGAGGARAQPDFNLHAANL